MTKIVADGKKKCAGVVTAKGGAVPKKVMAKPAKAKKTPTEQRRELELAMSRAEYELTEAQQERDKERDGYDSDRAEVLRDFQVEWNLGMRQLDREVDIRRAEVARVQERLDALPAGQPDQRRILDGMKSRAVCELREAQQELNEEAEACAGQRAIKLAKFQAEYDREMLRLEDVVKSCETKVARVQGLIDVLV
jgi:hypothetical protein